MKTLRYLLAIFVPVFVMAYWIHDLEQSVFSGKMIHVPVQGYDPRDLLAGHYLQYRLNLGELDPCSVASSDGVCVCFSESSDSSQLSEATWAGACQVRPDDCSAWLKGSCQGVGFSAGVERFYFPEGLSDKLLTIPEGASVMISTNFSGKGIVADFLVAGEPLSEYVRKAREADLAGGQEQKTDSGTAQ